MKIEKAGIIKPGKSMFHPFRKSPVTLAVLLIPAFIFLSLNLMANTQHRLPVFKRYTSSDGLPDYRVSALFQDNPGFLWIGTDNGLVKYDGYEMITYRHDPESKHTITGNRIRSICEDDMGNLWIGTEFGGLNRFERKTGNFSPFNLTDPGGQKSGGVHYLHKDRNGYIWAITGKRQLIRISPGKKDFRLFKNDSEQDKNKLKYDQPVRVQVSGMTLYSFYEDRKGVIWLCMQDRNNQKKGGLIYFDTKKDCFITVKSPDSMDNGEVIRDICEDNTGTIRIVTNTGKLMIVDKKQKRLELSKKISEVSNKKKISLWKIFKDKKGRFWLTATGGIYLFEPQTGNIKAVGPINTIGNHSREQDTLFPFYNDDEGRIWLKSWDAGGIEIVNPDYPGNSYLESTVHYPFSSSESSFVTAIFKDRFGILWIGTEKEGLFKMRDRAFYKVPYISYRKNSRKEPRHKRINAILESASTPRNIVIGSDNGLEIYDGKSKAFIPFKPQLKSKSKPGLNYIRALCEDSDGRLWVGTGHIIKDPTSLNPIRGGIFRSDNPLKNISPYYLEKDKKEKEHWVTVIYKDNQGELWVGTRISGLFKYDTQSQRFISYREKIGAVQITEIYQDRAGMLWIGTANSGLKQYDNTLKQEIPFEGSQIGFKKVTALNEDTYGNFWIGTASGGLLLLNRKTGLVTKRYSIKEGLPHPGIGFILDDDNGNLWIASGEILVKFDVKNKRFIKQYDRADGLHINSLEAPVYKNKKGEFLIGGREGIYTFLPGLLKGNPVPPKTVFTGFKIFDEDVIIGNSFPLKEHISIAGEIHLEHEQNDISFDFAAIHFSCPQKNSFKYRLENYDLDWRQTGDSRTVTYNNLQPGEFTFKVKGISSDNIRGKDASVRVIIKPPFWQTTQFRALFLAALLLLSLLALKLWKYRILKKQKAKDLKERNISLNRQVAIRTWELEQKTAELEASLEHLKKTQEQLVRSEKMAELGRLTSGIAHEIRNPLNFVINFSQLSGKRFEKLQEEMAQYDEQDPPRLQKIAKSMDLLQQNLDKIQEHGHRIDSITRSMLTRARGKKEYHNISLNSFIKENTALVYHSLKAKDQDFFVALKFDLDDTIGNIRLIPQDFSRAFINIATNACYAANKKRKQASTGFSPTVFIRTGNLEDKVEIQIRDNGNGIPVEDIENIFAPFYTTKPVGEGTGLGLFITRDIIQREHNGEINVQSVEGEYAEFSITIPKNLETASLTFLKE
ncbi:MAG: hypothetical protein GY757_40350 [bacterium]|nr:hypothetical protein [bacterium]